MLFWWVEWILWHGIFPNPGSPNGGCVLKHIMLKKKLKQPRLCSFYLVVPKEMGSFKSLGVWTDSNHLHWFLGKCYVLFEIQYWLVVSTPLKNITSSVGMILPNIWKIKNDPNHQTVIAFWPRTNSYHPTPIRVHPTMSPHDQHTSTYHAIHLTKCI